MNEMKEEMKPHYLIPIVVVHFSAIILLSIDRAPFLSPPRILSCLSIATIASIIIAIVIIVVVPIVLYLVDMSFPFAFDGIHKCVVIHYDDEPGELDLHNTADKGR